MIKEVFDRQVVFDASKDNGEGITREEIERKVDERAEAVREQVKAIEKTGITDHGPAATNLRFTTDS